MKPPLEAPPPTHVQPPPVQQPPQAVKPPPYAYPEPPPSHSYPASPGLMYAPPGPPGPMYAQQQQSVSEVDSSGSSQCCIQGELGLGLPIDPLQPVHNQTLLVVTIQWHACPGYAKIPGMEGFCTNSYI